MRQCEHTLISFRRVGNLTNRYITQAVQTLKMQLFLLINKSGLWGFVVVVAFKFICPFRKSKQKIRLFILISFF